MASSGSTDENFRARVEKIFGSLAFSGSSISSSSQPSLQPPTLWSLTEQDVEKREWRRDKSSSYVRDQTPCSSSFDELLKQQRSLRNLRKQFEDDLEGFDEDKDDQMRGRSENDGDEWSIRSSIGLDRTLDDEEEEDEYDKVASGRENAGERLYMKDVTDQGSSLDSQSVFAGSFCKATTRDPRGNHDAAKVKLKEDKAEAQKVNTFYNHSSEGKDSHAESPKNIVQPKPILKRKDNSSEARPRKRVRFDLGFRDNGEETSEKFEDASMKACSVETSASESESVLSQSSSQIPDYLLNPSRYTRYSFDSSSDIDEKSNSQAYMDFLKLVEGSKSTDSDSIESTSAGVPKKVTFIPKKKTKETKEGNSGEIKENSEDKKQNTKNIVVGRANMVKLMQIEDDDAETDAPDISAGFRKPGRKYRAKTRSEETDT